MRVTDRCDDEEPGWLIGDNEVEKNGGKDWIECSAGAVGFILRDGCSMDDGLQTLFRVGQKSDRSRTAWAMASFYSFLDTHILTK